jgi:hypothetical protein
MKQLELFDIEETNNNKETSSVQLEEETNIKETEEETNIK